MAKKWWRGRQGKIQTKEKRSKKKSRWCKEKKNLVVNGAKISEGRNKLFRVASQIKENKDMQWSSFIKVENILAEQNEVAERWRYFQELQNKEYENQIE